MEKMMYSIRNINKKYENKILYDNFDIDFYFNKVNCIVGKSGCGKSTILNILSGLSCNESTKWVNEFEDKKISYIFQEDRLLEWLTVEENIKLVIRKYYKNENLNKICEKYLDLVGIIEYKTYYPQMLSGGIRQRVNIVRGLIYPSDVIIMDEPFKSIDIKNKIKIMEKIKGILSKEKRTVLFVTHDIDEAIYLSDYIYILGGAPINIKKVIKNDGNINKNDICEII